MNLTQKIVLYKVRDRWTYKKLKRAFGEIISHPIMNIKPHSPFIGKPGLVEISEPKLLTYMDILLCRLTKYLDADDRR